jgi:2-C-methyl-D-erythritol 2,4-cyclodiphosphate synthase
MRVGNGYDSHRFASGRPLILGGVEIPDHPGLDGHSDADAVAHAVTDAILGAAALGDIGTHFPPSDERWRGADSIRLLARAVEILHEANYQVVNVDVTVITESPRLGAHAAAMRARLAETLGVAPRQVSVKAKSNEGMGWIGAREGLAVHAVALIDQIEDQDTLHARHTSHQRR